MTTRMLLPPLVGAIVALAVPTAASAGSARSDTLVGPWSDYDLTQFISVERGSPGSILKLDDNGELALLAVDGIDEEDLRARTGATESQIQLLVDWRLLERDGSTVRTAFPILDETATAELRRRTAAVAGEVADAVAGDVTRLRDRLGSAGRGANAYAIVFSYVLDGLTWEAWERSGAIREREVTASAPFWSGEVWATTPARENRIGTNRISDEGVALNVTWAPAAIPVMRPFVAEWDAVRALFEDFARGGPIIDPLARRTFAPYDLFDEDGRITIPVIVEDETDPVHVVSRRIATTIVERAPAALDLADLQEEFGLRDAPQTLIVAYHELMWDVLAELEGRGVVERPPILARPDQAAEADVAALVFGIRE